MSVSSIVTDAEIMSDLINADDAAFSPDVAQALLSLGFTDVQNARMRELADRNNRGELTADERHQLESFRRVGNFLALLQAKARQRLTS